MKGGPGKDNCISGRELMSLDVDEWGSIINELSRSEEHEGIRNDS